MQKHDKVTLVCNDKLESNFCFYVVIGKLPAVTLGYHADT